MPLNDSLRPSVSDPVVLAAAPVAVDVSGRDEPLLVRVLAPTTGSALPVVVFAHGFGWSMYAYDPLLQYLAGQGFAVVQPTFPDSRLLGMAPDDPRQADVWSARVADMTAALDHLDAIATAVPGLAGRLDLERIAAVGHSYGAQTAGTLLGARVRDEHGTTGPSLADPRVSIGVLLSATGDGASLTPFAAEHFAFMRPDFSTMTTRALIVAGDHDDSPLSTRGPDWFTDAYQLSPAPKGLYTVAGGEHILGGISGYDAKETTDPDPARVAAVRQVVAAYLQTELGIDSRAWPAAVEAVGDSGSIQTK